uniref:Reverse transcriptase domain-containing protein n=1 Tax=Tanacetum cinerariifolium TaxID=118510 RepID=A0A6L2MM35_TANCI|nr:reverse transcriptase domain-containing protein [Tanacetum cinerariifolium]
MDDEPMWATDRVVALTPGSAFTISKTAKEFAIKGNHLTLLKGNQFDGRIKTDPHKHIHKFLKICEMFKYRDIKNEVVRLMMFPLSLTGEAKTWVDKINEGTIKMWDELRTAFISQFFPPALFDRILREIRAFSQHEKRILNQSLAPYERNAKKLPCYDVLEGVEGVFVAAAKVGQQRGDAACLVTKRWKGGACKMLCKVVVMS